MNFKLFQSIRGILNDHKSDEIKEFQKIKIDFFKRILTDTVYDESIRRIFFKNANLITKSQMISTLDESIDEEKSTGKIWPEKAHTMIGLKRLNNIQFCVEEVIKK